MTLYKLNVGVQGNPHFKIKTVEIDTDKITSIECHCFQMGFSAYTVNVGSVDYYIGGMEYYRLKMYLKGVE